MALFTRKRIFEIVENGDPTDTVSRAYDIIMMLAIFASIFPLMFAHDHPAFHYIEQVTVTLFMLDYVLRWATADFKLKKGAVSFLIYPFSIWALIDLASILPAFTVVNNGFKILRMTRLLRIMRLLKIIRYATQIQVLGRVIKKESTVLLTVLGISIFYVFLTALVMFNAEPHINPTTGEPTFDTFFDALYWATVTLTTVGYGDMIPVTDTGRLVSMLSSLFGVAIIALPSGVITASYLDEIRTMRKAEEAKEAAKAEEEAEKAKEKELES